MTATNGWPDPARPGGPLNPEVDGWHWLLANTNKGPQPEAAFWDSRCFAWFCQGIEELTRPEKMMNYGWLGYLGPCLTPDEEQNLRDDLASAERERAHQHGRADRSAAEHAREQAKREALQARIAELEKFLRQIEDDCDADCPPSHGYIKYAIRDFMKGYAVLGGKKDE